MSSQRRPVTKELLLAFARGELDNADSAAVAEFLEGRPDLKKQVDALIAKNAKTSKSTPPTGAPPQVSRPTVASGITDTIGSEPPRRSSVSAKNPDPTKRENAEPQDAAAEASSMPEELSDLTEFRIVRELGRGGMGVVYLAEHVLTKRPEVLKVLAPSLMAHQEARRRFEQEAQVISALDHESIVRCYSVKPLRSCIVLCMQYLPGGDLESRLSEQGRLSVREACQITIDVASGLQHALEEGVIHRDIKPSNVMLYKSRGQLRAKITDFGLGRFNDGRTKDKMTDDGRTMGTLEYISPEQSRDAAKADIRSDIYSLGCTLYHMLTGNPPYSGSPGDLIIAHNTLTATPVAEIRDDVPPGVSEIIARMMAKTPEQRFQTPEEVATELSSELSRVAGGTQNAKDIQTKDIKKTTKAKTGSNSGKLVGLGVACTACVLLSVGIWWQLGRGNQPTTTETAKATQEADDPQPTDPTDVPLAITVPTLSPIKEGRSFSASLTVNRELQDGEEFRLGRSPGNMEIDPTSGMITWDSADPGEHTVEVDVIRITQDGKKKKKDITKEASAKFQITVEDVTLNSVPDQPVQPDQPIHEETTFSLGLSEYLMHKPEPGERFELVDAPTGMRFDPQTQQLTWDTTEQDDGRHDVRIGLLYSNRSIAEETFSIRVDEVNRPPVIEAIAEDTRRAGETFAYAVRVSDPDSIHARNPDRPERNELRLFPIGEDASIMTIDGGKIRGKVPPDRITDIHVQVQVSDGELDAQTPLVIKVRPLLPVEFPLAPELSRTPASVVLAQRLTSNQLQQPIEFSNNLRMTFRLIPGSDVEGQLIPPFYMSEAEVTEAQWAAVMGKKVVGAANAPKPVDSFAEAVDFCKKLSEIEGLPCRLPLEIEWEHAARAGTPGNDLPLSAWKPNTDAAIKIRNADESGEVVCSESRNNSPRVVMTGRPNLLGLYDLHGNLAEWCLDPTVFNFQYAVAAKLVSTVDSVPLDGPARFRRGGSWNDALSDCSFRARGQHKTKGTSGMRIVIPLPPKDKYPGGVIVSPEEVDRDAPPHELASVSTREDARAVQLACAEKYGIPAGVEIFGMPFVLIPPGAIITDNGRRISVANPFYLARTELTQQQWKQLREKLKALGNVDIRSFWSSSETIHHSETFPVENMSYEAAKSICDVLNKFDPLDTIRSGLSANQQALKDIRFRMPTRDEWEFASRAGLPGRFWCGEKLGEFDGNLKIGDNLRKAAGLEFREPTRVATSSIPNPFGLFDIYGNVAEYCKDSDGVWAAGGSYSSSPDDLSKDLFSVQDTKSGARTTGIRLMLDLPGIQPTN